MGADNMSDIKWKSPDTAPTDKDKGFLVKCVDDDYIYFGMKNENGIICITDGSSKMWFTGMDYIVEGWAEIT